ncbi:DsbA family protein [Kordiimonas sp. SCSIO 12610]|uniref:DsbA family protein n=1 Tax=Kordiimonas sp. SCSIO 12610 TaxID=2829597 RepID=UPI00210E3AB4|nr:DsbA family protein [Kordiimonas sp. SCSIO 12610]UTW53842.1 thioredoxin domain-containing protein [Kordiimonas sp. SCSIO 12610]
MKKFLLSGITASLLIIATSLQTAFAQNVSDDERQKIESVIQEYLANNPEIVIQAIQQFQRQRQTANMLSQVNLYRGYLENDPEATVLGNPNGDVTIVEFFDYRCGFCRRHFASAILPLLEEDKNIRFVPQQFPVLDRPDAAPVSRIAARAALASQKQGKFGEFHKALMTSAGSLTEDGVYQIAQSVGLDVLRLKSDMQSKLIDKRIENVLAIGRDIGFEGTPGYIIGDSVLLGAEGIGSMKAAIARARSKAKQASGR